jgi:hypothetical protein
MGVNEQTIDRATRALGHSLARGADMRTAMRAALAAAVSTGCLYEYPVVIDRVELTVGVGEDLEDGWAIVVEPGTDLAPLLTQGPMDGRIDRALTAAMDRSAARASREEVERRHDDARALGELREAA